MSDLIRRQAAISTVFSICCRWDTDDPDDLKNMLMQAFQDSPSADRPHGEWIMHIDDLFPCESTQECSVCHAEQPISISDDNFCPNCGAEMKMEE